MTKVQIPQHYDYIAVYLTDRCPLRCSYCITEHNDTQFITGTEFAQRLKPEQWAEGLNRLQLPAGVPISFQGGEPFVYPGIWELLELVNHPIDILTALPRLASIDKWKALSPGVIKKLTRESPYPTIRVSFHPGQNKIEDLVERVKEIQEVVNIGIYSVAHPNSLAEIERAKELCAKNGVIFKTKEFLGYHEGKLHGTYKFDDAVAGKVTKPLVQCKNSVLILAPDGNAYRCHSDLYHKRRNLAFGNISDATFSVEDKYRPCNFYGLCSECDVKVKTNHEQVYGYTSVDIKFPNERIVPVSQQYEASAKSI